MIKTNQSVTTGYYSVQDNEPSAKIAVKKNVQKNHKHGSDISKVYLDNNTEFEIELFNPKNISVLAKIKINGNFISDKGIVVKPGQRIFLDRFIDSPNKFLFETYEVNLNNSQVKEAIKNNGLIQVYFYDETIINNYGKITYGSYVNIYDLYKYDQYEYYNSVPGNIGCSGPSCNSTTNFYNNATFTSSVKKEEFKETGKVEQGSKSNTEFTNSNTSFNSWFNSCVEIQILPKSVKPIEAKDLAIYCTTCGRKSKKEENFCPSDGTKLR